MNECMSLFITLLYVKSNTERQLKPTCIYNGDVTACGFVDQCCHLSICDGTESESSKLGTTYFAQLLYAYDCIKCLICSPAVKNPDQNSGLFCYDVNHMW